MVEGKYVVMKVSKTRVVFTFLWARIAAIFANKAEPKTLNRATGAVLVILGIVVMFMPQ